MINRHVANALGVALAAMVGVVWCSAQDLVDRGAPGLLVRFYDIGQDMRAVPELAPGELPNVVKTVRTLDLDGARGDFQPLEDRFATEIAGFLNITRPGQYGFRLISDDGARLWIDDQLVIDHDGLHGADPKDADLELPVGQHALRVWHFDNTDDERLALLWQPPGTEAGTDFVVIPAAALTHDAMASRETAPGQKRILPPLRRGRPGDGSPLVAEHPGFQRAEVPRAGSSPTTAALQDGRLRVMGKAGGGGAEPVLAWLPPTHGPSTYSAEYCLSPSAYPQQSFIYCEQGESKRLYAERFAGSLQGCVFRLGTNRFPTESSRQVVFDMRAVRAMADGFEIEFTKPLDPRVGWDPESYYVEQWPFAREGTEARRHEGTEEDTEPGAQATGQPPTRDGVRYAVKSASVSPDRTKVFLEIENLKPSHVVYIRLLAPCVSEDGELPWSTEAWYTLNVIPPDRCGVVRTPPEPEPQNLLTAEEKAAGWKLLFDGQTTAGWRGYKKNAFPAGWIVKDGCLVLVGRGGDICTVDEFDNFELQLEWRICAGGNSGVFYRVDEDGGWPWETGPEMQVLDNAEHPDGRNPKTSAGSNYALCAPVRDVTVPVGLFNEVRIVVDGDHVEHWLNGVNVVEYELGSPEWEKLVAESKFNNMPRHGRAKKGRIVLQDHGDQVWYRNIKIRPLTGE